MKNKPKTISSLIHFAEKEFKRNKIFFGHGTDNAWDEAVYLVLATLNLPLDSGQKILEKRLDEAEIDKVLKTIDARIKDRVPTPYLMQEAWFAGHSFYVNKDVLIPRSPLAELINNCFSPWVDSDKVKRILEIGTGSGCIAIACAYAFPRAKIDAIDISSQALKVAAINCVKHKVTKRVNLIHSDLFQKLLGKTYDIIISNPPYVGEEELKNLPKEYSHEPKEALLAGKVGDEVVAKILADAPKYLNPKGILVVEVGNSADIIAQRYPDLPFIWLEFESGEGEVFLLTKEQINLK